MLPQLLIGASLAAAALQDVRTRTVEDRVWIPAAAGAAIALSANFWTAMIEGVTVQVQGYLLKLLIFVPLLVVTWAFMRFGQADLIALVLIAFDPYLQSLLYTVVGFGVAFAAHAAWLVRHGLWPGKRVMQYSDFKRDHRWIPRALIEGERRVELSSDVNRAFDEVQATSGAQRVEVEYGVPQVAYIAVGYVSYVVYLLLFSPGVLSAFP
jgi:hypothetical protein